MLPSTGIFYRLTAPHAGCAIEVKEDMAARASTMLENEMPIEQDGFHIGEERIVAVEMRPARLHHSDFWIGKMMNDAHEPVLRRAEVSVEDSDELALGTL